MLIRINSTATYWRLHIAQGLLAAHGVRCCIWHDHSATLYAGDGFLKCSLAIEEDDFEDAAEVLNSPAGEIPETETGQESSQTRTDIYPGFKILLLTGLTLSGILDLLLFVSSVVGARLSQYVHHQYGPSNEGVSPEQAFSMIVCWLLGGLLWATSTASLLLPLRWKEDSSWSLLWAYLFGRWVFPWLCLVPLFIITWLLTTLGIPTDPFRLIP
jgi:hypothetical protein